MGGWNKPSAANQPTVKKGGVKTPSKVKGIVAGLVTVCALGGLCLWMFSGGEDAPKAKVEKERGRIKEVASAPASKVGQGAVQGQRLIEQGKGGANDASNADGEKKAKTVSTVPPEILNAKPVKRVFKTATEQMLSWLCNTTPGEMPMPMPKIGPADRKNLVAILVSKHKPEDGDDERLAQTKEDVNYAKKELAKYIGEGGNPDDFFQYYYQELRTSFEYRRNVVNEVEKLYESGDKDMAREFCEKANEKLSEKGIKLVDFSEFSDADDGSEAVRGANDVVTEQQSVIKKE